jgi:hypothetical protein
MQRYLTKFCVFIELEISFPHSKKTTTGHYHKLDQMRSQLFLKNWILFHSHIYYKASEDRLLPLKFWNHSFTYISFFGLRTRSLTFLHLVRKEYKVQGTEFLNISIFTFLRSHVTLSLLCPNIFHSCLLSNTLNQSHCHTVGDAVSFGFGETSCHPPLE